MAAILEKQRIAKRRRKSSSRPINKSAGFYTGFMNQFNEKPVNEKKEKHSDSRKSNSRNFNSRNGNSGNFSFKKFNFLNPRSANHSKNHKKRNGLSFPVPSLAAIAITAGTIVIAFAALNWENINIDIPDIYSFAPVEDASANERIIQYASTGNSGIFQKKTETDVSIGETSTETAAAAKEDELNNHHGRLITFEWQLYRVKKGDAVSKIAENFGVSVGAIIASNEIKNARQLQEGAILKIPNIDGIPYQVKRGDSLSKISTSFNIPLEVILDVNDIKSDTIKQGETIFIPGARMNEIDLRMSLGDLFTYPLQSRYITSYYGMRKDPFNGSLQFHDGVDFRGKTGATVMASLDGVVSVVSESWLYGKFIILTHSNGYKTLYGHLSAYSVKQGDKVARGRKIGEVGNTGYSTGPHLHFGMYDKNGKLVNPLDLLN
ncbi:MAG: peptidoglycan DD-metalloendopeptidase family protein [Treponema sp.]|nr:peptidoglycan DD-metalloendopeptidase family protein [Treponema sp.]